MKLEPIEGLFAVCRLPAGTAFEIPEDSQFLSVTLTDNELSLVCDQSLVPSAAKVEPGWRCLRVAGQIPFETIGLLASLTQPLAEQNISVFAVSTFDTDYLLVKAEDWKTAVATLKANEFHF